MKLNILVTGSVLMCGAVGAAVLNEWTFETDSSGKTLTQAVNSGTAGTVLSGDNSTVTQTDGAGGMLCENNAAGISGLWTDGAILSGAASPSGPGEIRYLRYDVEYDMTASGNDSGTLLAMGFAQGAQTHLAGFALKYRVGDPAPPAGVVETPVETGLELTGRISVIAEVNLTAQTMTAWYDLTGGNIFDFSAPAATVSIQPMTSLDQLEFRATGDYIAGGAEPVVIDNMRVASSWEEITDPVADYSSPPVPAVSVFDDLLDGKMFAGQTNTVRIIIKNTISPATAVSSTLTFDSPGDFTILSSDNTPQPAGVNETVTNTYQVVAHTDGQYVFTARGLADGRTGLPVDRQILVGSRITAGLLSYGNEVGGIIPGRPEPGEWFELTISNTNSGALPLTYITNSLSAAGFSVNPLSPVVIPSLGVGETADTVYLVQCLSGTSGGLKDFTVQNRTKDDVWYSAFHLDVYRESALQIANSMTMQAIQGQPSSANIMLYNDGNEGTSFAVSDTSGFVSSYEVTSESISRVSFRQPADYFPETTFTEWNGTDTASRDIGFYFSLFGTQYQTYSVSQSGFMTLTSTNGATATVTPFRGLNSIERSTIRYTQSDSRLAVAWGNLTGQEFQAILNADGTIEYLYEYGTWSDGEIGLSDGAGHSQEITHTPGQYGSDALLLTPESWLVVTPSPGSIDGSSVDYQASRPLTLTATAPDSALGTNTASVSIGGNDNSVTVDVTVIVEPTRLQLDVPSFIPFQGPEGSISPPAILTARNSGNATVSYMITDQGQADAGYSFAPVDYQWQSIPDFAEFRMEEPELDAVPVDIGFPFMFFGNVYTNLIVNVDGTLMLGSATIEAYAAGLTLDANSVVRVISDSSRRKFKVIWESLAQPGGGDDQTFQIVLNDEGRVLCSYEQLGGDWYDGQIQLTDGATTVPGTLVTDETRTFITNVTYETMLTNRTIGNVTIEEEVIIATNTEVVVVYAEQIVRDSVEFDAGYEGIISFSPYSGTLQPGETADITLLGDARNLTIGDFASTALIFNYADETSSTDIYFEVIGRVQSAFADTAVKTAMWGSDDPVVSFSVNADGSRLLSWPAPTDTLSRIYTVWYTTSLAEPWNVLAEVENLAAYVDDQHNDEPVMFYRVTVQ